MSYAPTLAASTSASTNWTAPADRLQQSLQRFIDLDLVMHLDGKYLALAIPANPYH